LLLDDEEYELPAILARTLTCPGLWLIAASEHARVVADVHEVVPHCVPAAMVAPNAAVGVLSAVPKLRPEIVT
jgi:hypothetical protein